ncbi:MAG: FMN-binding negative transcriptional regulator [Erythrobacteraceae bacterium]
MHPNPLYRTDDRALCEGLIDEIGFGMVFAATPEGPRVAHTPLLSNGKGAVQFHLARSNALARHLDGETALIVVNGPDAYVSPRWYGNRDTVPTWDYVTLELEGRGRRAVAGRGILR